MRQSDRTEVDEVWTTLLALELLHRAAAGDEAFCEWRIHGTATRPVEFPHTVWEPLGRP